MITTESAEALNILARGQHLGLYLVLSKTYERCRDYNLVFISLESELCSSRSSTCTLTVLMEQNIALNIKNRYH